MTEISPVGISCPGFWSFAEKLYDKDGLAGIVGLFVAYAFYQLIWKVWSVALKGRDNEIQRLVEERRDRTASHQSFEKGQA